MKKCMLCVSVMVVVCFVAGLLFAAAAATLQVTGVVKSYSAETKELVVTVKKEGEGTDMTFLTTEETKVVAGREGAETKALTDLTEGTRVRVTYTKAAEEGGKPTATRIMILPAERTKAAK